MKLYQLLSALLLLLCLAGTSYAAFPVRVATADTATTTIITAPREAHQTVHRASFLQRARSFLQPNRFPPRENSESAKLSIVSFCLVLGAFVMIPLAVILGSAPAAAILIILSVLMGVIGFVMGIVALAQRSRLKGLAIAAVALGAYYLIYATFIVLLLAYLL